MISHQRISVFGAIAVAVLLSLAVSALGKAGIVSPPPFGTPCSANSSDTACNVTQAPCGGLESNFTGTPFNVTPGQSVNVSVFVKDVPASANKTIILRFSSDEGLIQCGNLTLPSNFQNGTNVTVTCNIPADATLREDSFIQMVLSINTTASSRVIYSCSPIQAPEVEAPTAPPVAAPTAPPTESPFTPRAPIVVPPSGAANLVALSGVATTLIAVILCSL